MDTTFQEIEKEKITGLSFPEIDVLEEDDSAISERNERLGRSLSLGNLEHLKIKIYFEDNQKRRFVDTTIWGVTDNRVILKKGVVIPIKRIHKIHINE